MAALNGRDVPVCACTGAGGPSSRYCGNLGHKQDDESGLIYMRARYYEPASGRFISEDIHGQDSNSFLYCGNVPAGRADASGKDWQDIAQFLVGNIFKLALVAPLVAMANELFTELGAAKGISVERIVLKGIKGLAIGCILAAFTLFVISLAPYLVVYGAVLAVAIVLIIVSMLCIEAMLNSGFDDVIDQSAPAPS